MQAITYKHVSSQLILPSATCFVKELPPRPNPSLEQARSLTVTPSVSRYY